MATTAPPFERIVAIDAVRGFAVCGILLMNIVAFAMPAQAYVDPTYYGGASGADLWAWAIAYVVADGKMRALFTMLFGASLLLITDRAEGHTPGPARVHYSRMAWLLVFGMLHAWLVWYGDILVDYALCGAIAFVGRRWRPSALAFAATCLIGFALLQDLVEWHDASLLRMLAHQSHPPAAAVREWAKIVAQTSPTPHALAAEINGYRGGFACVFATRAAMTGRLQSSQLADWIPGSLGLMTLGMLLHRLGFWRGDWSSRSYGWMAAAGALGLAPTAIVASAMEAHRFDPAFQPLADAAGTLLQPIVALGYAAALIAWMRRGGGALGERLAAAGRMAFTNYLGTSLVMTGLFYGTGLGLFARLDRAALYPIVLVQWLLILGWSKPWLARFRYGPFEFAWRWLASGSTVTLRQAIAS